MVVMFDTNMILRYLLKDNIDMAMKAKEYLRCNNVFITIEVIAEVFYVLKKVYLLKRDEIVKIVKGFLRLVHCKEKEVLNLAIDTFDKYNLDFIDCILYSYSKINNIQIATFDKKLLKLLNNI